MQVAVFVSASHTDILACGVWNKKRTSELDGTSDIYSSTTISLHNVQLKQI